MDIMMNEKISIIEADELYTQGFLLNPALMHEEKAKMDNWWDLEQALEVGLAIEEGNYRLYLDAMKEINDPGVSQLLKELVDDILKNKQNIWEKYYNFYDKLGFDKKVGDDHKVLDLGITDYLKTGHIGLGSTYQDVLIFAAKREKMGYDFFSVQAKGVKDDSIRKIWNSFAELKLEQKQKIENEYDEVVLKEN